MAFIISVDWTQVLDKYGWPTAALFVVVILVIWVTKKALIPFFTNYLNQVKDDAAEARKAAEEASKKVTSMLENQLTKAEANLQRTQNLEDNVFDGLKEALSSSVRRQDKQIELMSEVLAVSRETQRITQDTNSIARGRKQ